MRSRKIKKRFRRRSLMATAAGPWVIVGALALAVILAIFLVFRFAVPYCFSLAGKNVPWQPTPTPSPTPVPTPSPHPIENADAAALEKELLFEHQYVSDVFRCGDFVYYTAGRDDAGGPKMRSMYRRSLSTGADELLSDVVLANDDLLTPVVNQSYMVWLDHLRIGGGSINAKNLSTGEIFEVKRYYAGQPQLCMEGNLLAWTERTGSYMDKVFLYDLDTRENATLAMHENSPFGVSASYLNGGSIIWASYDPDSDGAMNDDMQGAIYSITPGKNGGAAVSDIIKTGTYVHDPRFNGEIYAWLDGNHSPDCSLWIMKKGGSPQKIATGIEDFALGSNFAAYSSGEAIHVYFYGKRKFDKQITQDGDRALMIGVSDDTVFWYQLGLGSKDIVKYMEINASSMPSPSASPAPSEAADG